VDVVLRALDGIEYRVSEGAVLGRVAPADIVIPDAKVSRRHAKFSIDEGVIQVEDLGSSNGTRVNGVKIDQATALSHGDAISIEHLVFTVVIDGADLPDEDATVIGHADDATVIGMQLADLKNVPGSWVEADSADSTQFITPAAAPESAAVVPRQSSEAHLIVLDEQGGIAEALGLDTESNEQTWEIGRAEQCDIQLGESTVSARHAQLVLEQGKWRVVNLVSSNGILVNGEKRLSAYLADGDVIGLGRAKLVFYSSDSKSVSNGPTQDAASSSRGSKIGVIVAVLVIIIAAIAAL
jgi:pSer/pThr/pTyr-binding forkhead associated (FHA) protein